MTKQEVVVVVGNGMVGHRFLERVKKYDVAKKFALVTIGEEPLPHYNRMLLTEYFEHLSIDRLRLATSEWYEQQGIALSLQSRVVAIDPLNKTVTCTRPSPTDASRTETFTVAYDRLVLATGSSSAMPSLSGVDLPGVFGYRTIADLDAIIAYCQDQQQREQQELSPKKYALVVGGGLLGLEAAKAIHDLGLGVRIINRGTRLMSRQLDDAGSKLLQTEIERKFGIDVLFNKTTKRLVAVDDCVGGVEFTDGEQMDDVFLVVFATGIVPRDELASGCGMLVSRRRGIVVNDALETSVDGVYALGECVSHRDVSYGLVAPGYEMADVLAKNFTSDTPDKGAFTGSDSSTKLKLMGMEVASFGACFPEELVAEDPKYEELVYNNPLERVYRRLFFSGDGKKLLGGILVGDASDFPRLTLLYRTRHEKPLKEAPNEILLGKRGGSGEARAAVLDLPDEAQVCSCNNVTKGELCSAIREKKLTTLGDVKKNCNAGTACGGCLPMVKDLLEAELLAAGTAVDKSLCEHFAFSRQELFQIIQVEGYRTFSEVLAKHGRPSQGLPTRQRHGCEICKPTIASILASLLNQHVLTDDRAGLQDSNDRFLANIQKSGQFSVVPRIAGGEITPDKLIVLGQVAKKYGLYTKITGGQRVDLFGAQKHELPEIWEALVEAGFESGHAYGKSLRTVKSCVGSTWCRFGVQDSVGFAIFLENRYKGVRSPHKIKGGVSGCTRECAEARGKDFGCIATEKGYNVFVCGNGGANPKHAVLLASDVPTELTVKYLDRFLMYYIRTADRLQRTSKWLESLEGGIDQLRRVIIDDALGICASLEQQMSYLLDTYECEWKRVVETPELREQFQQFANTDRTQEEVKMKTEREQRLPATGRSGHRRVAAKTVSRSPSPTSSTSSSSNESGFETEWVSFGSSSKVLPNTGRAVLYGDTQLALFNVTELCNGVEKVSWYTTQNVCPHDHAFVLAQGIVGDHDGHAKVACPMHKRTFALATGECLTGEDYSIETFETKEQDGELFVLLPPVEVLDARLGTTRFVAMQAEEDDGGVTVETMGGGCASQDPRLDW